MGFTYKWVFLRPMMQVAELSKVLSHRFSGSIWKLKTSIDSPWLAVECRRPDSREVNFSVFNYQTGVSHFVERSFGEDWHLSLWDLTSGAMILNRMDAEHFGQTKGMLIVNPVGGEVRSDSYNWSPELLSHEGVKVFDPRIQPRKFRWITFNGEEMPAPTTDELQRPELIYPADMAASDLPDVVRYGEIVGNILYAKLGEKEFYSFHERKASFLEQRLLAVQGDSILLDEILNSGIQNLQPEAFFIQQNHLFYICDKQEILTYSI